MLDNHATSQLHQGRDAIWNQDSFYHTSSRMRDCGVILSISSEFKAHNQVELECRVARSIKYQERQSLIGTTLNAIELHRLNRKHQTPVFGKPLYLPCEFAFVKQQKGFAYLHMCKAGIGGLRFNLELGSCDM